MRSEVSIDLNMNEASKRFHCAECFCGGCGVVVSVRFEKPTGTSSLPGARTREQWNRILTDSLHWVMEPYTPTENVWRCPECAVEKKGPKDHLRG